MKSRDLSRKEESRYFYDLLQKRFNIEKTIEIQRQDDIDTIANKALDFSSETIEHLIEQGIYDTLDKLYQNQKEKLKDDNESITKFKKWLGDYIQDLERQNTKDL